MGIMNQPISRRQMLGLSAATIATLALGDVVLVLSGCTKKSDGTLVLTFADKKFKLSSSSKSTNFSGLRLSLLPARDADSIDLIYCDTQGEKQATTVAPDGTPIHIQGETSLLAIDDTALKGNVTLDADASIIALCVGSIEMLDIAGYVRFLVVAGQTDVHLASTANVEYIIADDPRTNVIIDGDAQVGGVFTPFEKKVDDLSKKATVISVDRDYAILVCRACIGAAEGTLPNMDDNDIAQLASQEIARLMNGTPNATSSGSTKQASAKTAHSPFGVQKAYADEMETEEFTEEEIDGGYEDAGVEVLDSDSEGAAALEEVADDEHVVVDEDADDSFVDIPAANIGVIPDEMAIAALNRIGSIVLGKVTNYALPRLEDAIFGAGTSQAAKYELILEKLDQMELELKQIYSEIKVSEYGNVIDSFIRDYKPDVETWISQITIDDEDLVRKHEDPDELMQARIEYARDLMWPNGRQPYLVHGEGIIDFATRLCSAITQFYVTVSTDLFGAYFQLCMMNSAWEHHTIDGRIAFQDTVVAEFASIIGFATYAIRGALESVKDDDTDEGKAKRLECERAWNHLMICPDDMAEMAKEAGVDADELAQTISEDDAANDTKGLAIAAKEFIEERLAARHADDVRFLMAPGHELALYATAYLMKTNRKGTDQPQFRRNSAGQSVPNYEFFESLLKYYNETHDGSFNLYDIFFGEKEAQIALPEEHTKQNLHFAVNRKTSCSRVHQGNNTHYDYYLSTISKDCKHKDLKFAHCDQEGSHEDWTWYDTSAFGIFQAPEE